MAGGARRGPAVLGLPGKILSSDAKADDRGSRWNGPAASRAKELRPRTQIVSHNLDRSGRPPGQE